MRSFALFWAFLALFLNSWLSAQKPITLEDIWQNGTFAAKGVPGFNFQKDGVHYTKLEGSRIVQYDLRTGMASDTLLDVSTLKGWNGQLDGYSFSTDENSLLLTTGTESIYRWSTKANYFVFNTRTGALSQLHEGPKQRYATFSPDADKVAFVVDNDLYVKNLSSGKTTRITNDGRENAIINGASDWVYEEEFELVRAFKWSADGQKLAYFRFDESAVPEMTMEMYRGGEYPELVTFKYPKTGERNAEVTALIYDIAAQKSTPVNVPDRERKGEGWLDDYLPRMEWTPGGQLCLTWMNRHQNVQRLWLADANTGACRLLLEEKNKYYLDLHDVTFLKDGSGFVMQSEKSGFNHLYKYDMSGRQVCALTKGNYDVTGFYGLDEKNGLVYFQAAAENPMQRELYEVKLNGKKQKRLSKTPGTHSAQWSSTYDYFVDTYSTLNSPPQIQVLNRKGKTVRVLEQNTELAQKLKDYGKTDAQFFKFKTSENVELNGFSIRPTGTEFEGQKLPVLMFVYGGPGSQQVLDAWKGSNYLWFQMLAQQGYVVTCVDNRGTGARGEEFKKMTYKQLGKYETQDQIEAAKYLGTLPYVDPARIGIFGWSYGGYMSSLGMLKGNEVFQAGIAVAPVTNWKWYDSIYTERYMQTEAENEQGYAENSPVNFTEKLKGKYLLVHGLADDNVHFQHSAEMANQLISNGKQFDTMFYPNKNHGIGGGVTRLHLYRLMTNFLDKNLKNAKPAASPRP